MSLTREEKEVPSKSPWAFRMFSVAGIPIRLHFTFLLLLGWIAVSGEGNGGLVWVGLILAIFACVLLHELGHALVGRHYGIETRDITLYPMGGVAMLDGRPMAKQEFWISLAGPLVNVGLAAALAVALFITKGALPPIKSSLMGNSILADLFVANVTLAVFNLIPAFPMDGGRVLRAFLSQRMPEDRATQIAGAIGQGLAIVFAFVGLSMGNPILMLVAFFVFIGAGQEVGASVRRSFLTGHTVKDAMQTRFRTIASGSTLETAAHMLLEGSQHDFPVASGAGGEILGILTRNAIAQGLATEGPTAYVAAHMIRTFKNVGKEVELEEAAELFASDDQAPILVFDENEMVGMLTQENLSEFIMLEHARQQSLTSRANLMR